MIDKFIIFLLRLALATISRLKQSQALCQLIRTPLRLVLTVCTPSNCPEPHSHTLDTETKEGKCSINLL